MDRTDRTIVGSKAAAISNLVVHVLSEYTGRGPTRARTYINEDTVTVIVRDALTKAETILVANDKHDLVLTTRRTFQDTMRADLVAGVQAILGRDVIAFLSANHIDPDIGIESFVLAPPAPQAS